MSRVKKWSVLFLLCVIITGCSSNIKIIDEPQDVNFGTSEEDLVDTYSSIYGIERDEIANEIFEDMTYIWEYTICPSLKTTFGKTMNAEDAIFLLSIYTNYSQGVFTYQGANHVFYVWITMENKTGDIIGISIGYHDEDMDRQEAIDFICDIEGFTADFDNTIIDVIKKQISSAEKMRKLLDDKIFIAYFGANEDNDINYMYVQYIVEE